MAYSTGIEFEIERARKLVAKDHKQRWVYRGSNGAAISETPIPFKDAISVFWMPIVGAVGMNFRHAVNPHNAIGAIQ